jgi:hypothetical protein
MLSENELSLAVPKSLKEKVDFNKLISQLSID